jgi:hypothetical protein
MTTTFDLHSCHGSARFTLAWVEREERVATVSDFELRAAVRVYVYGGNPAEFFSDLAAHWRG